MIKRERETNFTRKEQLLLLEAMRPEADLLTGASRAADVNRKKEEVWAMIATKVNRVMGNNRTVDQLKKKWCKIRSSVSDKLKHACGTGGGEALTLTAVEELARAIIGENSDKIRGFGKY